MNTNLNGRVALVTGSSRGLGRAIAEALAAEKVQVIINGRDPSQVNKTAREIEDKFKISIHQFVGDATKTEEIDYFFNNKMPVTRLDVLVNNVGNLETSGLFFELKDEDWFEAFDLSFMSMIRFSRAAYPYLKKSGHGRIINISSLPAHQPGKANPHYAAAKGALLPVSKMLATEFAKDNILVNVICPSTLHGGGWYENVKKRAKRYKISEVEAEEQMLKNESAKSPLGRLGTLEEVANQVVFLASDCSGFVTGQCINVDGGITKSIL